MVGWRQTNQNSSRCQRDEHDSKITKFQITLLLESHRGSKKKLWKNYHIYDKKKACCHVFRGSKRDCGCGSM